MTRIGIYLRISDDQDGNSTATDRQREDLLRYAKSQHWDVAEVFEDRDYSAYKRKQRPEFQRMLNALRSKEIDGVLAWKLDRFHRRLADFVELWDACQAGNAFMASQLEGTMTRFMAATLANVAEQESENQSLRLRRRNEEMVKQGLPPTGGTRTFGYDKKRSAILPEEAALIKEAVERVYAGEGLRTICLDWEKRGVRTPKDKFWKQITIKRMLLSPALSAQREHRARQVEEPILTPGNWPAILTPNDTARLRLILNNPNRNKRLRSTRYLLSGLLRCGLCSEKLSSRPRLDGVRRYICARQPDYKNCGKLARVAEPIEEVVKEAVCIALDGVDLQKYIAKEAGGQNDQLLASIREDEQAQEQLSRDFYVDKLIGRSEWLAAREALEVRLESNRHKLAQSSGRPVLHKFIGAGDSIRNQWDDKDIDWKRSIISALIEHIVIEPAVKGRNTFDPSRVNIQWRF